ncbi:uncharacterized protein K452DRAFT_304582 [Aplosporella prunicola CBS 121167]|uniref:Autophagy-related protein 14 n=1 Tax=Aplosporella prunicola CBS 121167 TaxID=1176127 RepID=A0A6A6BTN8_9PEZI|nr:uncharacterized protein K452DRAFT_304582 [Aplosporella prunicola CBS 121167]KAF2146635.1 hypothetical protein K452DRAFT_304582 [Aplosporella prunicola CBS 121167]
MECDICGKGLNPKVPLNCPTCARAALYPFRIAQATTLLDRETLGYHVEAVATGADDQAGQAVSLGETLVDTHESSKRAAVEQRRTATAEIEERIRYITERSESLQKQIDEGKREIAARKAAIAQRRSDLESATYNIEKRRSKELDTVKEVIKAVRAADDLGHKEDVYGRAWHCKKAADVAGLKQRRRRSRDGSVKMEYYIGGIRILDLRDLNTAPPSQITASLTLLAGLVVRVSNYLAVRLPAEITLPHKDYPLPTIFSPSSSYMYKDVPFPGSTPFQSSSNSPEDSRTLEHQRPLPRPRSLYIDRKLPMLAAEDSSAYSLFLEGVTLLSWDIAWLSRSQGMNNTFNEWEDICPLGKNLWQLLIESTQATMSAVDKEKKDGPMAKGDFRFPASSRSLASTPEIGLGSYSHGTAKGFLGNAEGASFMKGWKLQTPARAVDKLRSHLLAEMQGAEWEMLDEKEFEKEEEADTDGQSKPRGVNGWTKLKSRNEETKTA